MGTQVRNSGTKEGVAGETARRKPDRVPHKQAVRRTAVRVAAVRNPMLALVRNYVVGYHFYENRFEERR